MAVHKVTAVARDGDGQEQVLLFRTAASQVVCPVPDGQGGVEGVFLDELLDQHAEEINGNTQAVAAKQDALTQAQLYAAGSGITAAKVGAYDGYAGQIAGIQGKIPAQADASNQLADKAFVNSTVSSLSANFVAADAQNSNFATKAALTGAQRYYHAGAQYQPTGKDYAVVLQDETQGGAQTRYVNVSATAAPSWQLQYVVNDAPFTAAQNSAIDSGITAAKVAAYDGLMQDIDAIRKVSSLPSDASSNPRTLYLVTG
ncbi:MAG: hypothetical protein LBQ15_11265 [Clostridium sp.]|jgi:hypothetical protein|nr:hypothetical protein [Clostridium sp.]